jgi:hypothetical protein
MNLKFYQIKLPPCCFTSFYIISTIPSGSPTVGWSSVFGIFIRKFVLAIKVGGFSLVSSLYDKVITYYEGTDEDATTIDKYTTNKTHSTHTFKKKKRKEEEATAVYSVVLC